MPRRPDVYVNRYHHEGSFIERAKITPALLMILAKHNSINAAKVAQALDKGEKLYTSFSYYQLAGTGSDEKD